MATLAQIFSISKAFASTSKALFSILEILFSATLSLWVPRQYLTLPTWPITKIWQVIAKAIKEIS